jgi:hypothetical protein
MLDVSYVKDEKSETVHSVRERPESFVVRIVSGKPIGNENILGELVLVSFIHL